MGTLQADKSGGVECKDGGEYEEAEKKYVLFKNDSANIAWVEAISVMRDKQREGVQRSSKGDGGGCDEEREVF